MKKSLISKFHRKIKFVSHCCLSIALFSSALAWNESLFAQGRKGGNKQRWEGRAVNREAVSKDSIRNRDVDRAFVAGALSQNKRDIRPRDYDRARGERYNRDRYRSGSNYYNDRYYDNEDNDNTVVNVLVGAAIGAIATGLIMKNSESDSEKNESPNKS